MESLLDQDSDADVLPVVERKKTSKRRSTGTVISFLNLFPLEHSQLLF